jgi:hypothetical protein
VWRSPHPALLAECVGRPVLPTGRQHIGCEQAASERGVHMRLGPERRRGRVRRRARPGAAYIQRQEAAVSEGLRRRGEPSGSQMLLVHAAFSTVCRWSSGACPSVCLPAPCSCSFLSRPSLVVKCALCLSVCLPASCSCSFLNRLSLVVRCMSVCLSACPLLM